MRVDVPYLLAYCFDQDHHITVDVLLCHAKSVAKAKLVSQDLYCHFSNLCRQLLTHRNEKYDSPDATDHRSDKKYVIICGYEVVSLLFSAHNRQANHSGRDSSLQKVKKYF